MPKMIGLMRLGRDAELRVTQSGESILTLALAYNYGKAKEGGNRPTTWIRGALWGKRAEVLAPYLTKGSSHCFTLDDLHMQTFQKQDGSMGTSLEARVLDVELGPRTDGQAGAPAPRPAPPPPRPAPPTAAGSGFDDMGDIPFRDPLSYRGMHLAM